MKEGWVEGTEGYMTHWIKADRRSLCGRRQLTTAPEGVERPPRPGQQCGSCQRALEARQQGRQTR